MNLENEKKRKLSNILFNIKWLVIFCACISLKIFMDTVQYNNKNNNDLDNNLIINISTTDSTGVKVIELKKVK